MKQGVVIAIMTSVAFVLVGIILVLILLNPKIAPRADTPGLDVPNPDATGEALLDPFCPSKLRISTYVVTMGTKNKTDDEVWISIMNPDQRNYSATISVNQVVESEGTIPAGSVLEIISRQMTEWWTAPSVVEKDGEVYISTSPRTDNFNVEVRVKDCEKQILLVTPDDPSGIGGGGSSGGAGGGAGGGSSSTTLKITRTAEQNMND